MNLTEKYEFAEKLRKAEQYEATALLREAADLIEELLEEKDYNDLIRDKYREEDKVCAGLTPWQIIREYGIGGIFYVLFDMGAISIPVVIGILIWAFA